MTETVQEKGSLDLLALVQGLRVIVRTPRGIVKAVNNMSFSIRRGEILGLLGETGSGKSLVVSAITDTAQDPVIILGGEVILNGYNIYGDIDLTQTVQIKSETNVTVRRKRWAIKRHENAMSYVRSRLMSVVFQEPHRSLDPVLSVGDQLIWPILEHKSAEIADTIIRREKFSREDSNEFSMEVFQQPDPEVKKHTLESLIARYGFYSVKEKIMDALGNSRDQNDFSSSLFRIAQSLKMNTDLGKFQKIRDYELLRIRISELILSLISVEGTEDEERIASVLAELDEAYSQMRSKFFLMNLRRRLFPKVGNRIIREIAKEMVIENLKSANIHNPEEILRLFPHEVDQGSLQRALISLSTLSSPELIVADEPTATMDVETQAQVLNMLERAVQKSRGQSLLITTKDPLVASVTCDRIAVLYAGNIVEEAQAKEIMNNAKHPYTTSLINSLPRIQEGETVMEPIPGLSPDLVDPPSGCRFNPRCKFKMEICTVKKPKLTEITAGHKVACFLFSEKWEEE